LSCVLHKCSSGVVDGRDLLLTLQQLGAEEVVRQQKRSARLKVRCAARTYTTTIQPVALAAAVAVMYIYIENDISIRKLRVCTEFDLLMLYTLQVVEQHTTNEAAAAAAAVAAVSCSPRNATNAVDTDCLAAAVHKLRTAAATTATTASCSTEDSSSAYAAVKMLRSQRDAPVSAEEVHIAAKSFGITLSAVEVAALATAGVLGLRSLYELQVRHQICTAVVQP
jgi:hypothetical protein